jgi:hypothetical protein
VRVGEHLGIDKQFFSLPSRLALPSLSIYNQRFSAMGNIEEAKLWSLQSMVTV